MAIFTPEIMEILKYNSAENFISSNFSKDARNEILDKCANSKISRWDIASELANKFEISSRMGYDLTIIIQGLDNGETFEGLREV